MPGRGQETTAETPKASELERIRCRTLGAGERPAAGPGAGSGPGAEAPAPAGGGDGAARLVAMSMALDGASRAEIATRLKAEFPAVGDLDALLDDVLSRAGR